MQLQKTDVLVYATTTKKFNETGLVEAVGVLSGNLIFLDDDTINAQTGTGPSRASKIGLLGVAEPCALATFEEKRPGHGKESLRESHGCHRTLNQQREVLPLSVLARAAGNT